MRQLRVYSEAIETSARVGYGGVAREYLPGQESTNNCQESTNNYLGIRSRGRCLWPTDTELICSLSYLHSLLHMANVMDISCAKPKVFVLARGR